MNASMFRISSGYRRSCSLQLPNLQELFPHQFFVYFLINGPVNLISAKYIFMVEILKYEDFKGICILY